MLHVAPICTLTLLLLFLCVVGSCCAKFETGQTFSHGQMGVTIPNIVGQQCWKLLLPFALSLVLVMLHGYLTTKREKYVKSA